MIPLKLPEFESMEKIRVRLDIPRQIIFKDGRKASSSQKTTIPLELKKYSDKEGVYIMCISGKVGYVGATTDFTNRMSSHKFLKNNPTIKHVFFLEINNKSQRLLYEMIYKYHYFGKLNLEWKGR